MTIRTRLYLLFGFMLMITLSANIVSWYTVNEYSDFNNRARALARNALEAEKLLSAVYSHVDFVRSSSVVGDSEEERQYNIVLGLIDGLERKSESQPELDDIHQIRNDYELLADVLYEQSQQTHGRVSEPGPTVPDRPPSHSKALQEVQASANRLVRYYEGELLKLVQSIGYSGLWAFLTVAVAVLLTALVLATLLIVIGRWLLSPLETLGAAAERIGSGDLKHRLTRLKNDEIGALGQSLNDMAAKLQQHQTKLLEARELAIIGAMSSSVAHGLRNPLAGIRVTAQFISGALPPDNPSQERIRDIIDEVDRMTRRITALLEFGKPAELRLETVALRDLIGAGIREAQAVIDEHNIIVTVENSTDDFWVYADRDQTVQTIAELLTNVALHAGDGTTATISADAISDTPNQPDTIAIRVRDKGSGMDEAERAQAFDLFYSTRQGGSGLGLGCAKRVAELHGGRLEIEPLQGPGICVRMELPRAARPAGIPTSAPSPV